MIKKATLFSTKIIKTVGSRKRIKAQMLRIFDSGEIELNETDFAFPFKAIVLREETSRIHPKIARSLLQLLSMATEDGKYNNKVVPHVNTWEFLTMDESGKERIARGYYGDTVLSKVSYYLRILLKDDTLILFDGGNNSEGM